MVSYLEAPLCMRSGGSSISRANNKSMLPFVIKTLILEYMSDMNRYTDLPSKNTIAKLVRKSDMFILDCLTKVTGIPTNEPFRSNYSITIDNNVSYYFRLTLLQKVRLKGLCERAIGCDIDTTRMIWIFLLATPPLYDEPDYRVFLETSLLVQVFTRVLNTINPLLMFRRNA